METEVCCENWKPSVLYESLKVPTKTEINEFSEMISKNVSEMGGTHMDAIIHHCEQTGMEVDVASSLISSALKAKIREEAQDLNLLKKSSKLPLCPKRQDLKRMPSTKALNFILLLILTIFFAITEKPTYQRTTSQTTKPSIPFINYHVSTT